MELADALLLGYAPMAGAIGYLYIRTNTIQDKRIEDQKSFQKDYSLLQEKIMQGLYDSTNVTKSMVELIKESIRGNNG